MKNITGITFRGKFTLYTGNFLSSHCASAEEIIMAGVSALLHIFNDNYASRGGHNKVVCMISLGTLPLSTDLVIIGFA